MKQTKTHVATSQPEGFEVRKLAQQVKKHSFGTTNPSVCPRRRPPRVRTSKKHCVVSDKMHMSIIIIIIIIHHSSFIIHHSSFIIHHSSFIIHHSSSIIHHPSSIIHHPSSSIIIHHHPSSSIIHHPSSIIHHPSLSSSPSSSSSS